MKIWEEFSCTTNAGANIAIISNCKKRYTCLHSFNINIQSKSVDKEHAKQFADY